MERLGDCVLTGGIYGEVHDAKQGKFEGKRLGGGGSYG